MKLVRCIKKHFFDSDMYDECPHCEEIAAAEAEAAKKTATAVKAELPPNNESMARRIDDEFYNIGIPDSVSPPASSPVAPASPAQESLQSLVNAAVADKSNAPEDVKTMAFYDFGDAEPVVGWLVCIRGEYIGQSFNLKAGTNFIGRALTMDVPLAKDTKVSRDKHAIIIYEPQNRVFFVQPGESRGLTYLNGELLLAYRPLNNGEKVAVGNSEFIFIPFCGENFAWEDYFN